MKKTPHDFLALLSGLFAPMHQMWATAARSATCALLARKYNEEISGKSPAFMSNKPMALTSEEMKEIAAIEDIRQMWGAETASEMEELLDGTAYAVKFQYQSSSPGYVGDYFILQGDALGEALELVRNKDGAIVLL